MKDLYKILMLDKSATKAEIQATYRHLRSIHHPDKGGDVETFKQIKHAYTVLINPLSKAHYDKTGEIKKTTPNDIKIRQDLVVMFINAIEQSTVFTSHEDVFELMVYNVSDEINSLAAIINKNKFLIEKLQKSKSKVHYKGDDYLIQGIDARIKEHQSLNEDAAKHMQLLTELKTEIKRYTKETPTAPLYKLTRR